MDTKRIGGGQLVGIAVVVAMVAACTGTHTQTVRVRSTAPLAPAAQQCVSACQAAAESSRYACMSSCPGFTKEPGSCHAGIEYGACEEHSVKSGNGKRTRMFLGALVLFALGSQAASLDRLR